MITAELQLGTIDAERTVAHESVPSTSRRVDPDADVIELVGDGAVTAALQRLMQRHGAAIYRYCRVALGNAVLAADVHQQVFIQVFRDLPRFRGRSTVRTWLLAIARHRVLDAAKSRRRALAHLEDAGAVDVPDLRPSPAEAIDDMRLREALSAALAELDEPVRTAMLMRYQQGLTFEEIAKVCGGKPGTLRTRVARALPRLRAVIESRLGGIR